MEIRERDRGESAEISERSVRDQPEISKRSGEIRERSERDQ